MALNLASVSGQQAKIAIDPKKAALGQTKWMSSQLKLDGSLQSVIYGINLKYQLKMDSVRLSISEIPIKMDMYQLITSKKK